LVTFQRLAKAAIQMLKRRIANAAVSPKACDAQAAPYGSIQADAAGCFNVGFTQVS
jgi:hypothetical protein